MIAILRGKYCIVAYRDVVESVLTCSVRRCRAAAKDDSGVSDSIAVRSTTMPDIIPTSAVVNFHVVVVKWLPARSMPVTVTVYSLSPMRAIDGMKVALLPSDDHYSVPGSR